MCVRCEFWGICLYVFVFVLFLFVGVFGCLLFVLFFFSFFLYALTNGPLWSLLHNGTIDPTKRNSLENELIEQLWNSTNPGICLFG